MPDFILPMIVAAFIAASASLLGSFAILKRMALVGDALSHVALPGLALALIFKINPFLGGMVFLLVSVVGIWYVENKTTLSLETVVGVFFTASLAAGALIMPEHELIEALFGNILDLSWQESLVSIALSIILILAVLYIYKNLTLKMLSSEMAHSVGINVGRLEFIYLLLFAVAVALGIRFVGALLMGSLVIIPAATSKNISTSLRSFMAFSVVFGVFAASTGIYVSYTYRLTPGPVFIIISTVLFLFSLVLRRLRSPA
jgi:ABC-type Mn2+/Zn2+ transport system permease subunit